jgi:hypothetical protein
MDTAVSIFGCFMNPRAATNKDHFNGALLVTLPLVAPLLPVQNEVAMKRRTATTHKVEEAL